jgi:phenylalanyl-tRNA synthetase alpha chain
MLNKTDYNNIPKFIEDKLPKKLHLMENHPICILKNHVYKYFNGLEKYKFEIFEDLDPIVDVVDNFDKLLIPETHPARSKSDTYYINETHVLRTHTSAHQNELLNAGHNSFLVMGDVYRKDEIDSSHYPVFHQMEMLTIINSDVDAETELKGILSGLVGYLFPDCNFRFNSDYFPFTNPSFEVEVQYEGKWIEILGCGIVQPEILANNGLIGRKAIAVGFGVDRLVMIFSGIPDIRYLWSEHPRFLNQFTDGKLNKFVKYSELPSQSKDISFFVPNDKINEESKWTGENDFFEIIRNNIGDCIEKVELIDGFYNKKTQKHSRTYRLTYSPSDPDMKDSGEFTKWVNAKQDGLRVILGDEMDVVLR